MYAPILTETEISDIIFMLPIRHFERVIVYIEQPKGDTLWQTNLILRQKKRRPE